MQANKKRIKYSPNIYDNIIEEENGDEQTINLSKGTIMTSEDLRMFGEMYNWEFDIAVKSGCFSITVGSPEKAEIREQRKLKEEAEFKPKVAEHLRVLYISLTKTLRVEKPIDVIDETYMDIQVKELSGEELRLTIDQVIAFKIYIKGVNIHIKAS